MKRTLEGHKVNRANDTLEITVLDEPGSGGAHHRYEITGFNLTMNPSAGEEDVAPVNRLPVIFQNGPIREAGVNGVTHEALIAILIDRLECFQAGPYASQFNADALDCLRDAQTFLTARTRERQARGVEGTHKV